MEGGGGLCRVAGPPRNASCTRISGTCVTCVTSDMEGGGGARGEGGGHHKVCHDTYRDMGKLPSPGGVSLIIQYVHSARITKCGS